MVKMTKTARATAREVREASGLRRQRRVPVQVTVPEDTYRQFAAEADAEGVAVGRLILRYAIAAFGQRAVVRR